MLIAGKEVASHGRWSVVLSGTVFKMIPIQLSDASASLTSSQPSSHDDGYEILRTWEFDAHALDDILGGSSSRARKGSC